MGGQILRQAKRVIDFGLKTDRFLLARAAGVVVENRVLTKNTSSRHHDRGLVRLGLESNGQSFNTPFVTSNTQNTPRSTSRSPEVLAAKTIDGEWEWKGIMKISFADL